MTESVLAILLLSLVLFAALQVAHLYTAGMIASHTAAVTARSYVVGFDTDIVQRASEIGSIGMAGHLEQPEEYANLTPAELGAVEPRLIERFVSTDGYTLWYQHWGRIHEDLPVLGGEGMAEVRIQARDYPLEMPMHRAYTGQDAVDFERSARLLNHAGYYLE
jgi:hypothetical protein